MLTKLSASICLMFLSSAYLIASEVDFARKEYIDGEDIEEEDDTEELFRARELAKPPCDVAGCSLIECHEAGPPPFCPRNVTFCRSGCACIVYCKDEERTVYCYQTQFCRTPRRFSPDVFTTKKMIFD